MASVALDCVHASVSGHLFSDLVETTSKYGFRQVANTSGIADAKLLLKRQTWNSNRAVVVVFPAQMPADMCSYLQALRKRVALRCGFFPFFYGIGIQAVIIAPGITQSGIDPARYVARIDNQWAIVQSVFFVDPISRECCFAPTWGQFLSGQFQDAIAMTLLPYFRQNNPSA
jgi:hypothetical protein